MIVGFCGYKGAGKNEAANALLAQGYQLCGFADALKAEVTTRLRRTCIEIAKLYYRPDIILDHIFTNNGENGLIAMLLEDKPPAFRRLLQEYGTEVRRADSEGYWVRQLETKFALTPYRERNFAITDVRFPNEVKMIHTFEGKLIHVMSERSSISDGHSSEMPAALDSDISILNNGTVDSLHSAVRAQLAEWERQNARKR